MNPITLRFIAEPGVVNYNGKVHGGTVMKWIDEAGYACATGWSKQDCVAVAVGGMRFLRPIVIGDLVEAEARLAYTGRTSMNLSVEVRSGDPRRSGALTKTTQCLAVFVAVDSHGRPVPVTPWNPETPGDIALAQWAKAHLDAVRGAIHPA